MRGSYLSTVYCFAWLGKLRDARCFANFANTVIPGRLQPLLLLREFYAIWKQTSLWLLHMPKVELELKLNIEISSVFDLCFELFFQSSGQPLVHPLKGNLNLRLFVDRKSTFSHNNKG